MVDIVAKYWSDAHSKQREYGKYSFRTLAHITHIAENSQQNTGNSEQTIFHARFLHKVTCKRSTCHNKHNAILENRHRIGSPKRIGRYFIEHQIALQHVHSILLKREYGGVIEYAKERHQPETTARKDGTEVADLERIVLLLSLTGLRIELSIHEEVNNKHDKCDKQQNYAERHRTRNVDNAP